MKIDGMYWARCEECRTLCYLPESGVCSDCYADQVAELQEAHEDYYWGCCDRCEKECYIEKGISVCSDCDEEIFPVSTSVDSRLI